MSSPAGSSVWQGPHVCLTASEDPRSSNTLKVGLEQIRPGSGLEMTVALANTEAASS